MSEDLRYIKADDRDLYWCSEGCGFVDKNHRCEQWTNLFHIPYKAVEKIKEKPKKKRVSK
jgi:hypothetical protein